MTNKPHAPATERNREPILAVLREAFANRRSVLEVGSGTGEHAVHFAAALPHLVWQCSDREENLDGIRAWLDEAGRPNTPAPLRLDVARDAWPDRQFDAAFSANSLHIMGWTEVEAMFAGLGKVLTPGATLAIYGPFRVAGQHTSDSNAAFDESLQTQAAHMGVRDLEAVDALARGIGLHQKQVHQLPANNLCVVWC